MKAKLLNTAARRLITPWLIAAGLLAALPGWAAPPAQCSSANQGQAVATATDRRASDARDLKQRLAWDRVGAPMQSVA